MRTSLKLISLSIQRNMYYRTSFVINLISPSFVLIGQYLLWIALFKQEKSNPIGGLTQDDFYSYILLAFALNNLFSWSSENKLSGDIKRGTIAALLIRPVSFLNQYISEMVGAFLSQFIVNIFVVSLGFLVFSNYLTVPQIEMVIPFLLCFILALLLRIMLIEVFSLMCFFTTSHLGITWIRIAIFDFFSGALIPIMLFPTWLERITYLTPFPYMIQVPIGILLGNDLPRDIVGILLLQFAWLGVFILIHNLTFNHVRKNLAIAGG